MDSSRGLRLVLLAITIGFCPTLVPLLARAQGLADLLEKGESAPPSRPEGSASPDEGSAAVGSLNRQQGVATVTNEQRRAAGERVREVFARDVSQAKTPAQKASVAKAMIQLVPEASEPAEAYVLLETAVGLAVDGQDPVTMDNAVGLLKKMFGVDFGLQRRDALIAMSKKAPLDALASVVDTLIDDGSEAADAGRLDIAKSIAKAAAVGARRLRDPTRQKLVTELLQRLSEQEKTAAAIQPLLDRLAANPKDGQALLELGEHRCYEEGNWTVGLKLLAGCTDSALAEVARLDLAVDGSPAEHEKVADLWFAVHEKEGTKGPTGPLERAKFHYEQAIGEATGLTRAQLLKRLDEITTLEGGQDTWIVVFRSNDPAIWNTKTDEGFLRFAVPLEAVPPSIRYVRIRRPNGDAVAIPINKQQLGEDAYGPRYGWRGAGTKLAKDTFLGICDEQQKLTQTDIGKMFIGYKLDRSMTTGWGFGHKFKSGTQTSMAWNGQTVPREPLEISVLARELSPKERRKANLLQ